jgi:hypothetical protein
MASTGTVTVLGRGREGVDTKELRALTKAFKGWKPDKQLHKALRLAGEMIAADAKILAEAGYAASYKKSVKDKGEKRSYKGSGKITPTIKVRVAKTRISVVAGNAGVPLAGLWELGNKGRGKSRMASRRGEFRHPVFGDRERWVNQPMHPFLMPAMKMNERKIEVMEGKAVAEAFREQGLKVSR